jgi:hypothetical protein
MPAFTRENTGNSTNLEPAANGHRVPSSGSVAFPHMPGQARSPRRFKPMRLGTIAIATLSLLLIPAIAHAQVSEGLSQQAIDWANQNIGIYTAAHTLARSRIHPPAPVPPLLDPPCTPCSDPGTPSDADQQIAAWVQQSEEPELDYITRLLAIERSLEMFDGMEGNLSPEAISALKPFGAVFAKRTGDDADQIQLDAIKLAQRLVDYKVEDMFSAYHKEPKQAYAGIKLILDATRTIATMTSKDGYDPSDHGVDLARRWEQIVVDKVQNDVLQGDNYNLCPAYGTALRTLAMLGGPADVTDQMQQTLQKIDKFLNFDVAMDLHALTLTAKGEAVMDLTWHMTSKLHIALESSKTGGACYTPSFKGNKMNVQVVNWSIQNEGDEVTLKSPRNFNVTMTNPTINICDKNPTLAIPFSGGFPDETVEAKGVTKPGQFFSAMLTQVVSANVMTLPSIQKMTGNTSPSPTPVAQSGYDPQAELNAHKGDISWIMGAQGQAAIAAIQKQAIGKFSTIAANQPTSAAMMATLQSALLPWTNGTEQTVDKTMQFTKNDNGYLTVTLQTTVNHAPQ